MDLAEEDVPYPRAPSKRDFSSLATDGVKLDEEVFVELISKMPRYGAIDYSTGTLPPAWSDEEKFYEWILDQRLPRELGELLFYHAPERSFMAGSGYIHGVESLIGRNSDEACANVRDAGFFIIGSGPNGDDLVIDLEGEQKGALGFFPIETKWGKKPNELRDMFIPIIESIGQYYAAHEDPERDLPGDYWDAKRRHGG